MQKIAAGCHINELRSVEMRSGEGDNSRRRILSCGIVLAATRWKLPELRPAFCRRIKNLLSFTICMPVGAMEGLVRYNLHLFILFYFILLFFPPNFLNFSFSSLFLSSYFLKKNWKELGMWAGQSCFVPLIEGFSLPH